MAATDNDALTGEMDSIVTSVQALVEVVQAEFGAAAGEMPDGRWLGLDTDARDRVTRKAREEARRLQTAFDRVQAAIDALPAGDVGPDALARLVADRAAERERLVAAAARLRVALLPAAGGGPS